jgi:hypothetical protein
VPGSFVVSAVSCFRRGAVARATTHTPKAHIAAQGARERIDGAMPMALSQFQPSASPAVTMPRPARIRPRRGVYQDAMKRHKPCSTSAVAGIDGFVIGDISIVVCSYGPG